MRSRAGERGAGECCPRTAHSLALRGLLICSTGATNSPVPAHACARLARDVLVSLRPLSPPPLHSSDSPRSPCGDDGMDGRRRSSCWWKDVRVGSCEARGVLARDSSGNPRTTRPLALSHRMFLDLSFLLPSAPLRDDYGRLRIRPPAPALSHVHLCRSSSPCFPSLAHFSTHS